MGGQSSRPIKIGLVGAGTFGGYHAWKVHDHVGADLVTVFDMDNRAATSMAKKFEAAPAETPSSLFDRVNAVLITSPAPTHAALGLQALSAGCHVFIEKPLALTLEDADRLIDEANARNLILQVGHQERYVADALGILSLPKQPREIIFRRCMPATGRGEDVSVIMDLMIHDLDLGRHFLGDDPGTEISLTPGMDTAHEIEAVFGAISGDLSVTCRASRRSSSRERSLTLRFDEGEIHLDFLERKIRNTAEIALITGFGEDDDTAQQPLALRDPLAYGFDCFIGAINGEKQVAISGDDGRRALELALRIEHAAGLSSLVGEPSAGDNIKCTE